MNRRRLAIATVVVGIAIVLVGAVWYSPPLAVIIAGGGLMAAGLLVIEVSP